MLIEQKRNIESVYVKHGGDRPETHAHIKELINNHKMNITQIIPEVEGYTNIYDFYFNKKIVPFVFLGRSCSDKWKIRPQRKYFKNKGEPYTLLIGFDKSEKHRANVESKYKKVKYEYPLIEAGINRKQCIKLIQEKGFKVPIKSDCFFCPFHSKKRWYDLARTQPDLFWKAVRLEENTNGLKLRKDGKPLRQLYPPPHTFDMIDTGCDYCVYGLDIKRDKT